jgi:GNAT superfamily N-acetyltransferase
MATIEIVEADLGQANHQFVVVELLNRFAIDRTGQPISTEIRAGLVSGLQKHPTTIVFLAYRGVEAVGIAVCFRGFSTFAARPLLNIHDLFVLPEYRGQGVGQELLEAIERKAREIDCCKLTLEVQENNHRARQVYEAAGFVEVEYLDAEGSLISLSKTL